MWHTAGYLAPTGFLLAAVASGQNQGNKKKFIFSASRYIAHILQFSNSTSNQYPREIRLQPLMHETGYVLKYCLYE